MKIVNGPIVDDSDVTFANFNRVDFSNPFEKLAETRIRIGIIDNPSLDRDEFSEDKKNIIDPLDYKNIINMSKGKFTIKWLTMEGGLVGPLTSKGLDKNLKTNSLQDFYSSAKKIANEVQATVKNDDNSTQELISFTHPVMWANDTNWMGFHYLPPVGSIVVIGFRANNIPVMLGFVQPHYQICDPLKLGEMMMKGYGNNSSYWKQSNELEHKAWINQGDKDGVGKISNEDVYLKIKLKASTSADDAKNISDIRANESAELDGIKVDDHSDPINRENKSGLIEILAYNLENGVPNDVSVVEVKPKELILKSYDDDEFVQESQLKKYSQIKMTKDTIIMETISREKTEDTNSNKSSILLSNFFTEEQKPIGTVVGNLSTTAIKKMNEQYTYSFVSGEGSTHNSDFKIEGNVLKTNKVFDFLSEPKKNIRIRSTSQMGNVIEQTFSINIIQSNTTVRLDKTYVFEDEGTNVLVGNITLNNPTPSGSYTYSIVDEESSTNIFSINGNKLMMNNAGYASEREYFVRIKAELQSNTFISYTFLFYITVIGVNYSSESFANETRSRIIQETVSVQKNEDFNILDFKSSISQSNVFDISVGRDGAYIAVLCEASPYILIYKKDGDNYVLLKKMETMPNRRCVGVSWSKNNDYLSVAVGLNIIVYKRTNDKFDLFLNLKAPPEVQNITGVGWDSGGGDFMCVTYDANPYFSIYKIESTNIVIVDLNIPSNDLPKGNVLDFAWKGHGELAISHQNEPYVTFYQNNNGVFSKSNKTLNISGTGLVVNKLSWKDSYFVYSYNVSPFFKIYKEENAVFDEINSNDIEQLLSVSFGELEDNAEKNFAIQDVLFVQSKFVVLHNYVPYITIYDKDNNDKFIKDDNQNISISGIGNCLGAYDNHLYIGYSTNPYLSTYNLSSEQFTSNDIFINSLYEMSNVGQKMFLSPNEKYMFVTHIENPFVTTYKKNGSEFEKENFLFKADEKPNGLIKNISFSANNNYVVFVLQNNLFTYRLDGEQLIKLKDINFSIPSGKTITFHSASWSYDEKHIVITHNFLPHSDVYTTPYMSVYERKGDVFVKVDINSILPSQQANIVSWGGNSNYFAVTYNAHPFLSLYKRENDGGFILLESPSTDSLGIITDLSWSSDGKFLYLTHTGSFKISTLKRNGDEFSWFDALSTRPQGNLQSVSLSKDSKYMSILSNASPYVFLYKNNNNVFTPISTISLADNTAVNDSVFNSDGSNFFVIHSGIKKIVSYTRGSVGSLVSKKSRVTIESDEIVLKGKNNIQTIM